MIYWDFIVPTYMYELAIRYGGACIVVGVLAVVAEAFFGRNDDDRM